MQLYKLPLLRRIAIPLLKRFNLGDITIKHPYTNRKLRLHSFRHKGYWYHGANREKETIEFFRRIIAPGQTVVEIGGHIGFMTQYFAQLVGEKGAVYVFEPGINNLQYIKQNVSGLPQVTVVECAVSNQNGTFDFYLDDLTGQNNSLVSDYEVLSGNQKRAFTDVRIEKVEVETVKFDDFSEKHHLRSDFIKIDIEGAELLALEGMQTTLKDQQPALMVEITKDAENVYELLTGLDYVLLDINYREVKHPAEINDNTFCLHRERHKEFLRSNSHTNSAGIS